MGRRSPFLRAPAGGWRAAVGGGEGWSAKNGQSVEHAHCLVIASNILMVGRSIGVRRKMLYAASPVLCLVRVARRRGGRSPWRCLEYGLARRYKCATCCRTIPGMAAKSVANLGISLSPRGIVGMRGQRSISLEGVIMSTTSPAPGPARLCVSALGGVVSPSWRGPSLLVRSCLFLCLLNTTAWV